MAKPPASPSAAAAGSDVNEALFDSRVVDRHIKEGRTSTEAYEAWLASQPDLSEECAPSDVRFVVRGRALATAGVEEEEQ
jgi:hypothetical protein